jgi:GTP:adenosylcobinamide-phosphate guanylyltransferase
MDAMIIAGGIPGPGEPLYEKTLGKPKAILELCGKPMVQWVIDALEQAETVDKIVLIGLTAKDGLVSTKIQEYIPDLGSMLANVQAGMAKVREIDPKASHVLIASADIPGIQPEMVNWIVRNAMKTDLDVYYSVIKRSVMEERYPNSKRSYTRLKDMEVCGGDMNVARVILGTDKDSLWEKLIQSRKNVLKQASLLGWATLFLLLTRQITLERAVKKVTKRLNLSGQAVVCPYAEVGMDVDKPFQLEIMANDLCNQPAAG